MTERLNQIELSPSDRKEIQSVHPKGDQSWVFIGRTDAEAENPILWHDEDLREPLVRRQGSQVSMRVARGSVLL